MTQAIERTERQLPRVPSEAEIKQWADVVQLTGYSIHEIALIRSMQGKDPAPPAEMAVFLIAARQLGLDPRIKECYWIRRQGKGAMQVAVDGFRKRAAMTHEYAGSDEAIYRGVVHLQEDGVTLEVPEQASVVVWRIVQGRKCAFTGTARWREYYPGPGPAGAMYRKMPYLMLAKDAETQGLRKGFSDAMSGMPSAAATDGLLLEGSEVTEQRRAYQAPRRAALTAADYDRAHAGEAESMLGVTPSERESIDPGDMGEGGWKGDTVPDDVDVESREGVAYMRALGVAHEKGLAEPSDAIRWPADRKDVLARTERLWGMISQWQTEERHAKPAATAQELDAQVEADSGLEPIP